MWFDGSVTSPDVPGRRRRQRTSHSLDSVLTQAVAILDESGPQGLTFRALAARLGGGVGSIYWYVSSRDELLDLAADHVMADVVAAIAPIGSDDPIDDLRSIGVTVFDAIVDRPWLGAYVLRDTGIQQHSLRVYETLGEHVFDFFLRNKRAEWDAYRRHVTPYELATYLPVL